MLACSSGRNLLLDILTKKKADALWLPSLTAACMDNLAGGKQLHTCSPCVASNCNLALQLALYLLMQQQSHCVRCTAGLRTCHICLAEPRLLLEQDKLHGQALCWFLYSPVIWSNSYSMPWTCLPLAALSKLLLDVCCCAGACALQLDLHDQTPELHPNIDNQFLTAVTVTEVSECFSAFGYIWWHPCWSNASDSCRVLTLITVC